MKHRSLAALLALLFCLAFLPSPAYAIDIWPNGTMYEEDTDTLHNWFGRADSVYDAAVYAMGHSPSELTDEMRLKLSDPNYGGDFYAYALSFYNVDGWFDIPSFVPTYALGTIGLVQDFDRVYASSRSISSYEAAFQDFLHILHGEDIGSGSGPVENEDDYFTFVGNPYFWYSKSSRYLYYINGSDGVRYTVNPYFVDSGYTLMSYPVNVYIKKSAVSSLVALHPYDTSWGVVVLFNQSGSITEIWVFAGATSWSYLTNSYQNIPSYQSSGSTQRILGNVNSSDYTFDGTNLVVTKVSLGSASTTSSPSNYLGGISQFVCRADSVTPIVPPPDGDWPSDSGSPAPVAPVLPEPDEEPSISGTVVVAPSVTWPDIDITINNNDPENTTPADYSPWLQAINASLNSLRSDLLVEFDAVQQSIRNIYYYLQHLDSVLESHCVHIRNQIIDSTNHLELYLRDLVHWLAEQLDYDANVDLDDNAIIAYLTQISSKMGGGTYEPNPISSEDSYYAWLDDLWDRFLLGDNWESSAQSISSSFSQLTTRFPFSIPWDIVALFRLFVHDPVTPVFDLPLFFSSDSYAPVHVDLSGWDGVASMVRPVIYVIFALKLALLSRDLLAGFGADKGGL